MCQCGHEKDVHAKYDNGYCEVEGCHCPWFEEEEIVAFLEESKDDDSTYAP